MLSQGQVLMDAQSDAATRLRFQNVILSSTREGEEWKILQVLQGKKSAILMRMKSFSMILVGFFHTM